MADEAEDTPETILDAIDLGARRSVQSVSAGGTSVNQMSVSEQIAADKYKKGEAAKSSPNMGVLRFQVRGRRGGL